MAPRHKLHPTPALSRHARCFTALALLLLSSCGSPRAKPAGSSTATAPAPSAAPAQDEKAASEEKSPAAKTLPTACADPKAKLCVPPADFVQRLCGGNFQEATLALFRKGTPWVRGYLTRTTDAWDASGGAASSDKVVVDEEVLILVHRAPDPGGMVVSGASGGYDVLRWNGSCATLMGDEVRMREPGTPKYAKITWKHLPDDIQNAMLTEEKISTLVSDHRKECKGATTGEASRQCGKIADKLARAIVEYVRKGGSIPEPTKLP